MESFFFDSINLLLRWFHFIAGIAWIGSSLYFVMLDRSLTTPRQKDIDRGVAGELWAVHGGGIYQAQKFLLAPTDGSLPQHLHWSKWEAYATWISGMGLLALIYWYGAEIYLIDHSVADLSKSAAIGISIAFLIGGWAIYDILCRCFFNKDQRLLSLILFVLIALAIWALCHLFSGRAAYIIYGAMLGTIMVANVFFVIIPGQKKMVAAISNNESVDESLGQKGRQRSAHNTYFTLPVLFAMLSNHYAGTYGHEYNWIILIALSLGGALIRVFFVSRHGTQKTQNWAGITGVLMVVTGLLVSIPPPIKSSKNAVDFSMVRSIVEQRCTTCHSAKPTQPGFIAPPGGIAFDTDDQINNQFGLIMQQSVLSKAMPIGNLTQMTDEERQLLNTWHLEHFDKSAK